MIDRVADVIREVAAEIVVPRFRALDDEDVSKKGAGELVTTADIEAEEALTARLEALAPGVPVIGEEGSGAYLNGERIRRRPPPPDGPALRGAALTRLMDAPMASLVAANGHRLGAVLPGRMCAGAADEPTWETVRERLLEGL